MPEAGRSGRGASPLARALALYADEPLAVRLHVQARHRLCPLQRIADHVPPHGRVLDVGCGHGLFGNLLALESARRQVVGVDPMASKIAVAQRVAAPTTTTRSPLAAGSRVPRWPAARIRSPRRTRSTTSCDVTPVGLSTTSRPEGVSPGGPRRPSAPGPADRVSSAAAGEPLMLPPLLLLPGRSARPG